jgi:hypothetical protein
MEIGYSTAPGCSGSKGGDFKCGSLGAQRDAADSWGNDLSFQWFSYWKIYGLAFFGVKSSF